MTELANKWLLPDALTLALQCAAKPRRYVVWALLPRLFTKSNDLFSLRPLQKDVSNAV